MNINSTSPITPSFAGLIGIALALLSLAAPVHSQTADSFNPGVGGRILM